MTRAFLALVLSGATACHPTSDANDSGATDGSGSGSTANSPDATSTVGDSADPDSTGGRVMPRPACADYLACLVDAEDPELADADARYGDDGTCWVDATTAAACAAECIEGFDTCALAEGGGSGESPPTCSLQLIAPRVASPVVMGDRADLLPTEIGILVENYCGCHLVEDNAQLVEFTPPYTGSMRFSTLAEFHAPFQGQPTYIEIERRSISNLNMPPVYHCDTLEFGSWPAGDFETFSAWLAADAPDGASWPEG